MWLKGAGSVEFPASSSRVFHGPLPAGSRNRRLRSRRKPTTKAASALAYAAPPMQIEPIDPDSAAFRFLL